MAYDQVYLLAGLYGAQETGVAATVVRIVEGLIRPESLDPDAGERLRGFLVLGLGELAGQEEYLLERYATILAELE
jgi:hypothetical protein